MHMKSFLTSPGAVVALAPRISARRSVPMAIARIAGALLLTALAAQVRVPVPGTDVPMTLQLLAVLVVGLSLPTAEALAAMTLYVLCGVCGLPVFSPGSAGLLGPTGGYLVGFVLGIVVIGLTRGRGNVSALRMITAAGLGAAVVLISGTAWRALWIGDWAVAATTMSLPFVPKAIVEVLLAVALVRRGSGRRSPANE